MAGQRSKDKKLVQAWIPITLYVQLEAEATRLERSKTDIVTRALREHFKIDPVPASASQLDEIKTAIVQLNQKQVETIKLIQEQPLPALPPETSSDTPKKSFFKKLFS